MLMKTFFVVFTIAIIFHPADGKVPNTGQEMEQDASAGVDVYRRYDESFTRCSSHGGTCRWKNPKFVGYLCAGYQEYASTHTCPKGEVCCKPDGGRYDESFTRCSSHGGTCRWKNPKFVGYLCAGYQEYASTHTCPKGEVCCKPDGGIPHFPECHRHGGKCKWTKYAGHPSGPCDGLAESVSIYKCPYGRMCCHRTEDKYSYNDN